MVKIKFYKKAEKNLQYCIVCNTKFTSKVKKIMEKDQAEELGAKKQKTAFFMAFNWPFSNYGICGL